MGKLSGRLGGRCQQVCTHAGCTGAHAAAAAFRQLLPCAPPFTALAGPRRMCSGRRLPLDQPACARHCMRAPCLLACQRSWPPCHPSMPWNWCVPAASWPPSRSPEQPASSAALGACCAGTADTLARGAAWNANTPAAADIRLSPVVYATAHIPGHPLSRPHLPRFHLMRCLARNAGARTSPLPFDGRLSRTLQGYPLLTVLKTHAPILA